MKKQSEVNYRTGDEKQSCANCAYYEPPDSCTQVSGVVSAGGMCDLWTPKVQQGPEAGGMPDQAAIESMLFGGGI